eukprot:4481881-Pleurochrysis_carterae.AAC.1
MQGLFRFLLAGDAGPAPQGSRSVHQPNGKPALAGLSLDSTAAASTYPDTRLWESSATSSSSQALVDSLVGAVRRYDVSRNRRELDDGHLSASQKKREVGTRARLPFSVLHVRVRALRDWTARLFTPEGAGAAVENWWRLLEAVRNSRGKCVSSLEVTAKVREGRERGE